jgi:Transposase DDE domain
MSQSASLPGQRQHLHFDALVQQVRRRFETLPEQRRAPTFPLADTLMAGLALYSLKDPSLLAFCRRAVDHNLRSVFGLQAIPSDTQMREILDEVGPDQLRPLFTDLFRQVQRGKVLEDYVFLEGGYLVALDGVEYFCSHKVHCAHCMSRQHRNGEVSYYHQLLGAVIVHPDFPEVIPLAPEPIQRQDGQQKNDCERNAARRWLQRFRRDHPHLPIIVVEDALSSNAPHIRDLRAARCHFILGVKPGDHAHLFEQVRQREQAGRAGVLEVADAGTGAVHRYVFVSGVGINEANQEVQVNFLRYQEIRAGQVVREWTWVTDLELTAANVERVARAGRARWRIENETFNTLKNQGYHFEHNYGHGQKHLAVVMALLMMLAFGIDQVQQKCNQLFRQAWAKKGPKCALWEAVRNLFAEFEVASMREIYAAIAYGQERPRLQPLVEQALAAAGKEAANTS